MNSENTIGKPVPRKEGRAKVTGAARYVDDLALPGDECAVVTARDVPGANHVALILNDQPYLADGVVNHAEEPVLLLAHPDKYLLEEARRAGRLEIEPRARVFNIEEALAAEQVVWGEDNVFKPFLVEKGEVDEVWTSPGVIVVE